MKRVLTAIRERSSISATSTALTVSVGGSFVSDGIPVTPEQTACRRPTKALYEAKAEGRDRAAPPRNAVGV